MRLEIRKLKAVDYIQYVWKESYDIDKSKSQIRRDIQQGAIKLNDKKLSVDDEFTFHYLVDDEGNERLLTDEEVESIDFVE